MKNKFDRIDVLAALGLFAAVAAWAFLWAHPYPHPDLWPFLVAVQGKVGPAALGVAGRLVLGVFAAFVYLDLRGFWMRRRKRSEGSPDNFCYTRTAPICGAAFFALCPYSWRAAQFLSPGFALLVLTLIGVFFWLRGRGGKGYLAYSLAFLLFGFAGGMKLLGLVPLGLAAIADASSRWMSSQSHGQRKDDESAQRKKSMEAWFSILAGMIGFVLGASLLVMVAANGSGTPDGASKLWSWWSAWTFAASRSIFAPTTFALVFSGAVVVLGLASGQRIRSLGHHGRMLCQVLSAVLALAVLAMLLRSVDLPERIRLQAIREYAAFVADDVGGAKFLFTDGQFDEMLRLEFAARGLDTAILNTMTAPTQAEAVRLKTLALEPSERALFEAGGAEVFKAWARERPDRLTISAWQLGGGIVRRHRQLQQRTHGTVIRGVDEARAAADDAADARFIEWTQHLAAIAEGRSAVGSLLGGTDDAVAAKFDVLLWRAARIAGERVERLTASKEANAAEQERQTMQMLDGLNASLRAQGEVMERMLPTEKLVLTAREALEIALKRADFELARRYANEILAGAPEDSAANFALGMAELELKDYFRASVCFEKALATNPNEPAALNNLAIAYMKLGQGEKALECAERAAKIHPQSAEILQTLAEIRKQTLR